MYTGLEKVMFVGNIIGLSNYQIEIIKVHSFDMQSLPKIRYQ